MIDRYKPIKGHFKILALDKYNNIIDEYIQDNLIMDTARVIMADLLTTASSDGINKLVLGTEGTKTGDILSPKDASDGFVSSRTELFSEESAGTFYELAFTPGTVPGLATGVTDSSLGNTVNISTSGTNAIYTFEVGVDAANFGGSTVYTEAALYSGTRIFSMKTFGAKLKDSSVKLRIIWTITF